MRRRFSLGLVLAILATLIIGGAATASGDRLVGTWHQRDNGHSNIFYFVDDPVGGVYPVLYYDDATGDPVCGDNGPMLWAGFVHEIDPNTFEGSFGTIWCPDNGDSVHVDPGGFGHVFSITIDYDPDTDTISGGPGVCEGTRQPSIDTVAKAIHELEKGKYPPVVFPAPGC